MAKRDYYEVLGVDRASDDGVIKKAYRNLAMKYHPDKNGDDPSSMDRMKEINEAYAVLSNPEKRRLYDAYGHHGLEGMSAEDIFSGTDFASIFRESGMGGFGGIFDSLFGRAGGATRTRTRVRQRGADLRYDLEVSLEDVAQGVEKTIDVAHSETCASCRGSGASEGGSKTCDKCRGSGQIVSERVSGNAIFRQISSCGKCRGSGRVVTSPCKTCQGKGAAVQIRDLRVAVPRGADSGFRIRLQSEGDAGEEGTEPGDLYVVIKVKKHHTFERHGDDLYVVKDITYPRAALGGAVKEVPAIDGTVSLDIPAGTQNGAVFRIPGRGMPHLGDYGRGDLYVVARIAVPTDLTEAERKLLLKLDELRK